MFVYSYYNRKVGVYQDPQLQPVAKDILPKLVQRSVVLNPQQAEKDHMYECDLFYLGTFDEEQGTFDLLPKPEFLCSFANLEVNHDA